MTSSVHVFAREIYPRAAVDAAVARFAAVCDVRVDEHAEGTQVTLELPEGAGPEVAGEFCNIVLITSVELQLGERARAG